jgi:hypothetical protein
MITTSSAQGDLRLRALDSSKAILFSACGPASRGYRGMRKIKK